MNNILFVVFSTLEAVSMFTIMLHLFRFNVLHYYKQLLAMSVLMSLFSLSVWNELHLSEYAPVILIAVFILFLFFTLRISIIGSTLVVLFGYSAYALIQTLVLLAMESFEPYSTFNPAEDEAEGYVLQAVSSIITLLLSHALYKRGYGFTFSLDRFKWKGEWENRIMFVLLCLGILFVAMIPMFKNSLLWVVLVFIFILAFQIYLYIKKEQR
ncbi:hypothetical protein [Cohnella nanjingensis]|uniref:Uncharacterized protein n=1 Tax=Cohnella nanjingensis TaxID=1387779 RepID=A0A7X0RRI1_9BACL|nr:hypothetical protein [Cohnella nanjingensis]MBB6672148.1 hypothetical protein [Cohnella nanjingensis]